MFRYAVTALAVVAVTVGVLWTGAAAGMVHIGRLHLDEPLPLASIAALVVAATLAIAGRPVRTERPSKARFLVLPAAVAAAVELVNEGGLLVAGVPVAALVLIARAAVLGLDGGAMFARVLVRLMAIALGIGGLVLVFWIGPFVLVPLAGAALAERAAARKGERGLGLAALVLGVGVALVAGDAGIPAGFLLGVAGVWWTADAGKVRDGSLDAVGMPAATVVQR